MGLAEFAILAKLGFLTSDTGGGGSILYSFDV